MPAIWAAAIRADSIRVFAESGVIAPEEGVADDVHVRSQHHVLLQRPGFASHHGPIPASRFFIECRGQPDGRRHGGGVPVDVDARRAVGKAHGRNAESSQPRPVTRLTEVVRVAGAVEEGYLLSQAHLPQKCLDAGCRILSSRRPHTKPEERLGLSYHSESLPPRSRWKETVATVSFHDTSSLAANAAILVSVILHPATGAGALVMVIGTRPTSSLGS